MRLAEGHARHAACYSAKADGAETAEEAVIPRLRCLRRLGFDVFAGTSKDIIETVFPFVDVVVVNGTVVLGICGSRGRHCKVNESV